MRLEHALFLRIISAVAAALIAIFCYVYFGNAGIFYLIFLLTIIAILEFNRMAFQDSKSSLFNTILFPLFSYSLLYISVYHPLISSELWAALLCLYMSLCIWLYGSRQSNDWLLNYLTKSALGFFYVVLLPVLSIKTLELQYGATWFLMLLVLVFSGDTLAYFGGKLIGKRKLSPQLSPKKTIEGGFFGLLGSCLATWAIGYIFFPQIPALGMAAIGLIAGLLAQTGDLFESLLKRVANVKDSGKIMPGHGGVLDRIDGVLFASPIVYLFAFYAEKFLI